MTTTQEPAVTVDDFAERVFGAALETFDVLSIYVGESLGLYAALADPRPADAGRVGATPRHPCPVRQEWLEQPNDVADPRGG